MRALNPESFHVSVNDTPGTPETVENSDTDLSPEAPYIWIILSIIMTLIAVYGFKLIK